ncbi:hypothetical protein [Hyunsoonleella pacifica]|uniref:Preprotein translocase subunit SecB n=1 Tax=Hyunsoonleella pacifica TaxID=1080224 RepID=A0A4V6MT74_9FLAO|nr:hypothetical protein [Hyunsoonleella pacifica]TBN14568.1 hypothetical protein EYD46_13435 [Hyunsoonleella pacifica]GGD14879.1 hypothetical protein GCM10011368_16010 [Hyunsoonleella pacifica]
MKKSDISIEIFNAKALSFQVNNDNVFEGDLKFENINIALNSEFQIDEKNSAVGVKIDLTVILKENEKDLFGLSSFFEFGVYDLKDVLIKKDKNNILDSKFARKLLNIAIGGSRGMLSVYLSSTQYKGFTLPIANIPDDFFED